MISKTLVRQQFWFVLQMLNTALMAVVIMFVLSGSMFSQAKLPFVGTRTFCFGGEFGEDKRTNAIITIRADGFTTIKTNAYNGAIWGGDSATFSYENFSGKMDRKGNVVWRNNNFASLEVKSSGTAIRLFGGQDWLDGSLCDSSDVPPKETTDVKPPPDAPAPSIPRKTLTLTIDQAKSILEQLQNQMLVVHKDARAETAKTDQDYEKIRLKEEARLRSLNRAMNQILAMEFPLPIETRLGPYDDVSQRFSLQISPNYQETVFVPRLEAQQLKENFSQASNTGVFGLHLDAQNRAKEYLVSSKISYSDKVYNIGKGEMSVARAMFMWYGNYDTQKKRSKWTGIRNAWDEPTEGTSSSDDEFVPLEAIPVFSKFFKENGTNKFIVVTGSLKEGNDEFDGCHSCGVRMGAAVFAQKGNIWKPEAVQRLVDVDGSFGKPPEADLVKIGVDRYALTLESGNMYQGFASGGIEYFDRVNGIFKNIGGVNTYSDNSGATGDSSSNTETVNSKLEYIQGSNPDYFDIKVISKGEKGVKVRRRVVMRPFTEVKIYKFSGACYKAPGEARPCDVHDDDGDIDLETLLPEGSKNTSNETEIETQMQKTQVGSFKVDLPVDPTTERTAQLPAKTATSEMTVAERARNTHVFKVRDGSKKWGMLTVAPGLLSFEPKKANTDKNVTIQCSDLKYFEQGKSTVNSSHINLFLTSANPSDKPVVFYTASGGGILNVTVNGVPRDPLVDITADVMNAIAEACKLHPVNY